jgi:hypothetical protein
MRTTFVITDEHQLRSAIRPRVEPHQLTTGARIVMASSFETPYGTVPAGTKGFICRVDEEDGTVEALMEGAEPALWAWNNTLVLSPFTCEDLLVCTKLSVDKTPPMFHEVPRGETDAALSPCSS